MRGHLRWSGGFIKTSIKLKKPTTFQFVALFGYVGFCLICLCYAVDPKYGVNAYPRLMGIGVIALLYGIKVIFRHFRDYRNILSGILVVGSVDEDETHYIVSYSNEGNGNRFKISKNHHYFPFMFHMLEEILEHEKVHVYINRNNPKRLTLYETSFWRVGE